MARGHGIDPSPPDKLNDQFRRAKMSCIVIDVDVVFDTAHKAQFSLDAAGSLSMGIVGHFPG
jgi:hypothetical protein